MPGINKRAIADHLDPSTIAAAPLRQERVIMPSSRHSVLAKAARYRTEPHRVQILVSEPLVALVHGLHAEHTVDKPRMAWSVRASAFNVARARVRTCSLCKSSGRS